MRREAFKDVPLISEMLEGKVSGQALSALKSWLNAAAIGKYYALPPNTPTRYLAAYREAFVRMQEDPDFQEKARIVLDPDYVMMSAEDTQQLVTDVMQTSDADRAYLGLLRDKHGLHSEAGR